MAVPPRADAHLAPGAGEADRVADEVRQHLFDPLPVDGDVHRISREVEADLRWLRERPHRVDDRAGDLTEVRRPAIELHAALVHPRQREEVLHGRAHAIDLLDGTLEHLPRGRWQSWIAESDVDLRAHDRERRPELV